MELQHIMIYGFMLLITYLFSNDYIAHICIYKSMFMNIYIYMCLHIGWRNCSKKTLDVLFFCWQEKRISWTGEIQLKHLQAPKMFPIVVNALHCWLLDFCFTLFHPVSPHQDLVFLMVLILYLFCFLQAFECTCCFMLTKGSSRLTVAVFNPF